MRIKFNTTKSFNDCGHVKLARPGEILEVKDESLAKQMIEHKFGTDAGADEFDDFFGRKKPAEKPKAEEPAAPVEPYKLPTEDGAAPKTDAGKGKSTHVSKPNHGGKNKASFGSPERK